MENRKAEINLDQIGDGNKSKAKRSWKKPKLEDVSGKVMAQPYIRFT